MGAGLGGLVAQTGGPYATADYFDDARFRHTHDIDEAVSEEGLVAILGVPLRLGQRVIGVLFAANRSARPFAQEEVALLARLAAHAAVAIDNARLLQETRNALEELSRAHRTVREHSEAVERAATAHDRMTALVLRGGGVEDVAAVGDRGARRVAGRAGRPRAGRSRGDAGELDAGRVRGRAGVAGAGPHRAARATCWIASVDVGGGAALHAGPAQRRLPTPTSASWSGPRWSPRCCCCSAGPSPRPRAGSAASCSTT